jgi:phenylacetate-CoA ligase
MAHALEKIYPFVPVLLQNLGISLYGMAWKRERLGGDFQKYVEEFRARDRWSPEQMRNHVNAELRRVLCRAFDHVPFYQRAWKDSGVTRSDLAQIFVEDLPSLPVTPKQALRENPDAFVAQNIAQREKLNRYFSSGSTGTPITAICTNDAHRRFIAAREVRSFGWAGSSIHAPRAMIGGRMVVPKANASAPFHRYNFAEQQVYFSAYHIAPSNVHDYVRGFNEHRPRLLTGYANSYFLLARMMNEQGIALDYEPDAIVLCSEKLTPQMKAEIQRAFRARAFEEYGAVENCVLATECEHGSLHVNSDFGVLEIVDDNNEPVAPGVEGEILCTGLLNDAQPLIRYEIGDVGIWSENHCECGRNHLPVLKEIVGRLEDVVVGPDRRELVRFHGIFIDLPGVVEGQVIQETLDEFTVKIVTRKNLEQHVESLIRTRFAERLGQVNVKIERVAEIPRTERGKFRAVISQVKREHPRITRMDANQN